MKASTPAPATVVVNLSSPSSTLNRRSTKTMVSIASSNLPKGIYRPAFARQRTRRAFARSFPRLAGATVMLLPDRLATTEKSSSFSFLNVKPLKRTVIKFPDGSTYSGEIDDDGRLNGQGEWRSSHGDSFVGEFEKDEFGRGCYTESSG
eukprot:CAMPEP_0114318708 /NCGR_PEP_ID=MMETSP0059-20121206/24805_1 /TAXON_ID=36894 /ORGANISM="Pyramimonas parkeae, Strain CCMP726" /LENGTH=148 /DNA_ID=CAMNT_0001445573 /DNA_START=270 /DNA_END=712 /DNA_ORIENTATION=+